MQRRAEAQFVAARVDVVIVLIEDMLVIGAEADMIVDEEFGAEAEFEAIVMRAARTAAGRGAELRAVIAENAIRLEAEGQVLIDEGQAGTKIDAPLITLAHRDAAIMIARVGIAVMPLDRGGEAEAAITVEQRVEGIAGEAAILNAVRMDRAPAAAMQAREVIAAIAADIQAGQRAVQAAIRLVDGRGGPVRGSGGLIRAGRGLRRGGLGRGGMRLRGRAAGEQDGAEAGRP